MREDKCAKHRWGAKTSVPGLQFSHRNSFEFGLCCACSGKRRAAVDSYAFSVALCSALCSAFTRSLRGSRRDPGERRGRGGRRTPRGHPRRALPTGVVGRPPHRAAGSSGPRTALYRSSLRLSLWSLRCSESQFRNMKSQLLNIMRFTL